jgi:nucleoside-diphosphate-sugar epimerase
MPSQLLIAGHGYLGQELGRQALAADWQITALSLSGGHDSLACDLSNREAVTTLKSEILDLSSLILTASSGRGGPEAYRAVFLDGTRHLLDTFPTAHLLFVSSTSVYHQCDGSLVTEESPTLPDRETSQLLLEAESLVLGARGTVARLAGIYGPGRSAILKRFLEGSAVIEEDGRLFLNQVHRHDAASALLHLASHPDTARGQIYNVADSSPLHQGDCYHALAQIFEKPVPPTGPRPEGRKRAWTHKRVSNAKLIATGWEPTFPSFVDAAREVAESL